MKAWENNIRKISPYVPGEQPKDKDIIKLNTNENPYPPAPGVGKVLASMDADRLRLYPDPEVKALVHELANYYNLENDQVFVGVGSDDVLAVAFMTFFNSGKPILFPDITYSFYPVWCNLFKIPYKTPKLDGEFRMVPQDYYEENGGVVIANPNAPTSIYEDLTVLENIIQHNSDVIVIIDEAYIDFAGRSAVELVNQYDNLLVVQTFSKSRSMAGMRIGYAMGNSELIRAMNDVKYSFNSYTMNMPSILAGVEAVKDEEYFRESLAKIIETRQKAIEEFLSLGFSLPESKSNFVFVTHPKIPAKQIYEALKEQKIYVRYFDMPRINNYIRVTIGREDEMNRLFTFLKKYLENR
ncbi:MAG TPA: histidinol-phosphate transaminase [Clostridiales bacterium]|jgi:histidinol-phosphate aminotransferase|nr:histidinol-phosphate transaminase [Clostridiales bacterium]